jgi:hypothetical protein
MQYRHQSSSTSHQRFTRLTTQFCAVLLAAVVPTLAAQSTVYVPAAMDAPGIDSGVDVLAGQQVMITASGVASYGIDSDCGVSLGLAETDPSGLRYLNGGVCPAKIDPSAASPSAPIGALLARIGAGPWLLIGHSNVLTVASAGRVFLLYNDVPGQYANNGGGYMVSILVRANIQIGRVELSSGGSLSQAGALDFAGGKDWGKTVPDKISGFAVGGGEGQILWEVEAESMVHVSFERKDGQRCDFRIDSLPPQDLYVTRPAIHFKLIAILIGAAGAEVARDDWIITQSDLGRLRQEYVDHPLKPVADLPKVPPPSAFNGLEIISGWASQASASLSLAATGAGLPTSVNSVYRSPVHHWRTYQNLRPPAPVTRGSQHMWGSAVDFQVNDYNQNGRLDQRDWTSLRRVASQLGLRVINEGRFNHVHVQEY